MIVFDLKCAGGHVFEEWFASSADFEERKAAHAVACPECGDTEVGKALMAPRIASGTSEPAAPAPCGLPACAAGGCQMAGLD